MSKNVDSALFWGYELYYSGFQKESFELLWKIYYDFYATVNPTFEQMFLINHSNWLNKRQTKEEGENDEANDDANAVFGCVLTALSAMGHSMDVFILRQIVHNYEKDYEKDNATCNGKIFKKWLIDRNYERIAYCVLKTSKITDLPSLFDIARNYFMKESADDLDDLTNVSTNGLIMTDRKVLLSRIMTFYAQQRGCKQTQALITSIHCNSNNDIKINSDAFAKYATIIGKKNKDNSLKCPSRKILASACNLSINESKYLHLFNLNRLKHSHKTIERMYRRDWLYYASFSPYWSRIIDSHGGTKNDEMFKIQFSNMDKEEQFYETYGLDPDEQSQETQNKALDVSDAKMVNNNIFMAFYLTYSDDENNNFVQICEKLLDDFKEFVF